MAMTRMSVISTGDADKIKQMLFPCMAIIIQTLTVQSRREKSICTNRTISNMEAGLVNVPKAIASPQVGLSQIVSIATTAFFHILDTAANIHLQHSNTQATNVI